MPVAFPQALLAAHVISEPGNAPSSPEPFTAASGCLRSFCQLDESIFNLACLLINPNALDSRMHWHTYYLLSLLHKKSAQLCFSIRTCPVLEISSTLGSRRRVVRHPWIRRWALQTSIRRIRAVTRYNRY